MGGKKDSSSLAIYSSGCLCLPGLRGVRSCLPLTGEEEEEEEEEEKGGGGERRRGGRGQGGGAAIGSPLSPPSCTGLFLVIKLGRRRKERRKRGEGGGLTDGERRNGIHKTVLGVGTDTQYVLHPHTPMHTHTQSGMVANYFPIIWICHGVAVLSHMCKCTMCTKTGHFLYFSGFFMHSFNPGPKECERLGLRELEFILGRSDICSGGCC